MAQRSICPYFITGCHIFNNFVLFDALWAAAQRLVSLFAVDTCRPFFLLNIFIWTSSELPWVIDDARPVRHTDWLEPFFPALSIFPAHCHLTAPLVWLRLQVPILSLDSLHFTSLIYSPDTVKTEERIFAALKYFTEKITTVSTSVLLEFFVKMFSLQAGFYFCMNFHFRLVFTFKWVLTPGWFACNLLEFGFGCLLDWPGYYHHHHNLHHHQDHHDDNDDECLR